MIFTPREQFSINTLLPIRLRNVYISFTNSSLYLLLATGLVVLFLYLITLNGGYLLPTRWQSVVEMIYQFIGSAKEDMKIMTKFTCYFTNFEVEPSHNLIKASSAELFLMAVFFYLIITTIFDKGQESRRSEEKHQPWVTWVSQMMPQLVLIFFVTVILFLTNPIMQNILGKKVAILISQPVTEKMLLAVVVLSGIILLYLCYKFKQWCVARFGDTFFELIMILLGVGFISYMMHSKVYPGIFTIWQISSIVMGSVLAFSIFFYYLHAKKLYDLEVIPVTIKKIYLTICVARVIPFFVLASQSETPIFLFMFLYLFQAMMSLVSILVGWTMLEISLPAFKYRLFKFCPLEEAVEKIKYMWGVYNPLLVCQGDLELDQNQVKPVEAITLKMQGASQAEPSNRYRGPNLPLALSHPQVNPLPLPVTLPHWQVNPLSLPPLPYPQANPLSLPVGNDLLKMLAFLERGEVILCWGALRNYRKLIDIFPISYGDDGKIVLQLPEDRRFLHSSQRNRVSASIYRVGFDHQWKIIGLQPVSPLISLPHESCYEEGLPTRLQSGLPTRLQSLEPYYRRGASMLLHSPQPLPLLLYSPQPLPRYLPPLMRINHEICINQIALLKLWLADKQGTRGTEQDFYLNTRRYVPLCHVSEIRDYIDTVESNVQLFDESYRKEIPIQDGSKVISLWGELRSSQSPVDAVPPGDALSPSPEAIPSVVELARDKALPNLNSNREGFKYLPFGEENLLRLERMVSNSGGMVAYLLGWDNGVDQYRVAIDFQGKAVGLQPVVSSVPLDFPCGPTTLEGCSIDDLRLRSTRDALFPTDLHLHTFNNRSLFYAAEATRFKLKLNPVHRINNLIYIELETVHSVVTTSRGFLYFQGEMYSRVCNCDYRSFMRMQEFWVNNLKLIRVHHPFTGAKDEIRISGTTWRLPG